MDFTAAIIQLEIAADVCETNAPINEGRGDHDQAKLERTNAANYRAAIKRLNEAQEVLA